MTSSASLVNIDEQDFPTPLYKYREWSKPLHKTILTQRKVYFAAPTTFEDEMELRNFKRFDLMNDQEIYDTYFQRSRIQNPGSSLLDHSAFAIEWTQRAPFRDPKYLRDAQEQQFKNYDARVGILSLTDKRDTLMMWDKYPAHGQGFCIGFHTSILYKAIRGGLAQVQYPAAGLPIINGTDTYDEQTWKQVFHKTTEWSFEQEHRFFIFNPNILSQQMRIVVLPKEAYKEIILGWETHSKSIRAIINACQDQGLNVNILKANKSGDNVLIEEV